MLTSNLQAICRLAAGGYVGAMLLSQATFAQAKLAERSAGPTLGGFFDDMASWGSNHPGAAIALSVALLMAIGMGVYGRITNKGK